MQSAIVGTQRALDELCEQLAAAGSFALDTEFVRERTFYIQLGIVQVAVDGVEAVIDPHAVSNMDALFALLANPDVEKVVHAGEQDFAALYEMGNVVPRSVFDTQIAAALVGYGDQISYQKLVARVTGVQLSKLETLTDWTARPLTDAQIEYSLEDVRYLAAIRKHLGARLAELGRTGWEVEECQRLEREATYQALPPEEYYKRLKTGGLGAESLGVLRTVAAWREEEARGRDLPRGWVMKDQSVLEIARRRPTTIKQLKQIRSLKPHQVSKDGESIVAAVRRGAEEPVDPQPSERGRLKVPPQIDSVARFLEAWVYARATEAEIAPSMLASRGELKDLAIGYFHSAVPELRVLTGWRLSLVGQDLLDLLGGKKSLKLGEGTRVVASDDVGS